ncbi:hypothetical protein WA1_33225 [Scytonema hofmannii PCC 7110]|uniref:Isopropylmalate/homocitrate/citramalate synthase n=1 Tax=Scytonema hofmannii PCC 7110 TaxID=128403 RepID=A0A139X2E3_9CYAN|nr:hypothetical protein [Scytonema hofmannii]KYC38877.1 hypothetical protein WA1_33225 [Scytonema hofmannii PCC 7110]
MKKSNSTNRNDFIYPYGRYYGKVKPENLAFNANLQEFAQKLSFITGLETSGKLTPEEAYNQIEALWEQLKHSTKMLGIGNHDSDS